MINIHKKNVEPSTSLIHVSSLICLFLRALSYSTCLSIFSIEPFVVIVDVAAADPVVVIVDVVVRHGVVVVDVIVEVVLLVVVDEVLQVHKDVSFKIVLICA